MSSQMFRDIQKQNFDRELLTALSKFRSYFFHPKNRVGVMSDQRALNKLEDFLAHIDKLNEDYYGPESDPEFSDDYDYDEDEDWYDQSFREYLNDN